MTGHERAPITFRALYSFWTVAYCANEYMKDHIFELQRRYKDMINHRSYTHNLSSCEIKA